MNTFFSIIIPVYNSQKNFASCLKSALDQDFKNYEILIVDDASTDKSINICNKYKLISSKIRIIRNVKNLGVSLSRNKGIIKSKGRYIIFLDSDDILYRNCLKDLYKHILKIKSNIIILKHNELKNTFEKKSTIPIAQIEGVLQNTFQKNKKIKPFQLVGNFDLFNPLCWNFALKKKFIIKNKIFFDDIRVHEDHIFVSRIFYTREKASNPGIITHGRRSTGLQSLGRTIGFVVCISCIKSLIAYIKDYQNLSLEKKEHNFFISKIDFFIEKFFLNFSICSKNNLSKIFKYIKRNNPHLSLSLNKLGFNIKLFEQKNLNLRSWHNLQKKFLMKLNHDLEIVKLNKINIFCASAYSKICINLLKKNVKIKIKKVFDNNVDFQNQNIEKFKINSPKKNNANINKNTYFLICNTNNIDFQNIKKQLIKLKIKKNKIIKFDILKYYDFLY